MSEENTKESLEVQEIDVEKIMEEIRADIKAKGYTADMLSFQDVAIPEGVAEEWDFGKFDGTVNAVGAHWDISWYRPLTGGSGKLFIKKAVRKVISIVMRPIVEDQHIYNMELAETANQLRAYVQMQEEKNAELEKRIELLEQRVAALRK